MLSVAPEPTALLKNLTYEQTDNTGTILGRKRTVSMPAFKNIRTTKGEGKAVYPVVKVTLGQSMAVVIGRSLYFMTGVWNRMTEDEVEMAGKAARLGREWIGDHPVALAKLGRLNDLVGRGSCCMHTAHLVQGVKTGRAVMVEPGGEKDHRVRVPIR